MFEFSSELTNTVKRREIQDDFPKDESRENSELRSVENRLADLERRLQALENRQ